MVLGSPLFQWAGQLACSETAMDSPSCSSKDRISCLRFSLEDAALKGTAFMDSNQVLSVEREVV